MDKPVVALVDVSTDLRQALSEILSPRSFKVFEAESGRNLLKSLHQRKSRLAIIPEAVAGTPGGLETAAWIRKHDLILPLIVIAFQSSEEQAIEALRVGVNDYLRWPCAGAELLASVRRTLASPPARALRWHGPPTPALGIDGGLTGRSESMSQIKGYLRSASLTDSNVLITGETGTGKERVAALIHAHSERQDKRMICINCAAVPESLLESELFGHEKGAFTGADTAYEGKLELADGGTVFFDEIGDMSVLAQTKILRAVESKQVYRLGGKKGVALDFRVVAATNRDLEQMIQTGTFRKDLYYRLNVARIHLPPLRERKEDIPLLISQHLQELNERLGTEVGGLDDDAMELMLLYDWPGNIRELKNVIEAALISRPINKLSVAELPHVFRTEVAEAASERSGRGSERDSLLAALLSSNWNKSRAAQKLNWSRMTVYRKMRKYHIPDGEAT